MQVPHAYDQAHRSTVPTMPVLWMMLAMMSAGMLLLTVCRREGVVMPPHTWTMGPNNIISKWQGLLPLGPCRCNAVMAIAFKVPEHGCQLASVKCN